MARRSEHTQAELKAMVIQAAETIIIHDGLKKLTVRHIATEIGYTVGSVYMVFDNMASLIMHLKGRVLADIAQALEAAVSTANSPQDNLKALALAYLSFAQQHLNRWHLLYNQDETARISPPEWYVEQVNQLFVPVINEFQRLAPKADEIAIKRAAHALWGSVHGICSLALNGSMNLVGVADINATLLVLVNSFIKGWSEQNP